MKEQQNAEEQNHIAEQLNSLSTVYYRYVDLPEFNNDDDGSSESIPKLRIVIQKKDDCDVYVKEFLDDFSKNASNSNKQ